MSDSARHNDPDRDPDIDEIGHVLAGRLRWMMRQAHLHRGGWQAEAQRIDLGQAINSEYQRNPPKAAPVRAREAPRDAVAASGEPLVLARIPVAEAGGTIDVTDYARQHPDSAFARSIETLVATLTAGPGSNRIVTLSPLERGGGATSLALCLADMAGKAGKRVLLIDADSEGRGLSTLARVAGRNGLAEVLDGRISASKAVIGHARFKLLPVGRMPLPAATESMRDFLAETRKRFDLVLIDAPAFAASSPVLALARLSEIFAFVVSRDRPVPATFIAAIDKIAAEPAFAGLILNRTARAGRADLDVAS